MKRFLSEFYPTSENWIDLEKPNLQGGKLIAFFVTELFRVNQQRVKKKLLEMVAVLDSRL